MDSKLPKRNVINIPVSWNEDIDGNKYELIFKLPEGEKKLSLTCDNVDELKSFYNGLIGQLLEKDVEFKLEGISDDDCKKDVYKMAAKEYIKCLQTDFENLRKEYENLQKGSLEDIK